MDRWIWIMTWYALASCVTFVVYAFDKRQASRSGRRVSERTLQLLALAGGWVGAHVSRAMLRHKSRKRGFGLVLWAVTLLHIALLTLMYLRV